MSHERGRKRAGGFGGQERDADAFGEGVGVLSVARSDVFRAGVFVCRCRNENFACEY